MTAVATRPPRVSAVLCDNGAQVRVWCQWCDRWHHHGAVVLGHRAAHCRAADSPYRQTGYVLVPTKKIERCR